MRNVIQCQKAGHPFLIVNCFTLNMPANAELLNLSYFPLESCSWKGLHRSSGSTFCIDAGFTVPQPVLSNVLDMLGTWHKYLL